MARYNRANHEERQYRVDITQTIKGPDLPFVYFNYGRGCAGMYEAKEFILFLKRDPETGEYSSMTNGYVFPVVDQQLVEVLKTWVEFGEGRRW